MRPGDELQVADGIVAEVGRRANKLAVVAFEFGHLLFHQSAQIDVDVVRRSAVTHSNCQRRNVHTFAVKNRETVPNPARPLNEEICRERFRDYPDRKLRGTFCL